MGTSLSGNSYWLVGGSNCGGVVVPGFARKSNLLIFGANPCFVAVGNPGDTNFG